MITNNQDELKLPPHITFLQGLISDLENVSQEDVDKFFEGIEFSKELTRFERSNDAVEFIGIFWNIKTKKLTVRPVTGETYYIDNIVVWKGHKYTIENIKSHFLFDFEPLQRRLAKEVKRMVTLNCFFCSDWNRKYLGALK